MKKIVLLVLSFIVSFASYAGETEQNLKSSFQARLANAGTSLKIETIEKSAMPGFYSVQTENGPLLYVHEDGEYFFTGELYQFKAGRLVSVTDQDSAKARIALMKHFNVDEMIVFSPKLPVKTKAHITVYTDVDCYYCQKLHQEVPELNARGIEVRYMAFPRAGANSASGKKLVSAWCSENPQDAMTRLKRRETIESKSCNNPIAQQLQLGKRMGVSGTPAIILPDGEMIPGYKPAKDLADILGI